MRSAYSIDAGRVLPADELDYSDCRSDRVTCEYCGNRVFKGIRSGPGGAIHYLSHYRAQSEQARRCEARAAMREREQSDDDDAETRGQALHLRVGALRRVLDAQFPERAQRADRFRQAAYRPTMRGGLLVPPTQLTYLRAITTSAFRMVAERDGIPTEHAMPSGSGKIKFLMSQVDGLRSDPPIRPVRAGRRQRRLADDMRALLAITESARAVEGLHDHAWASIILDGWTRRPTEMEAEAVRRMEITDARPGGDVSHLDETSPDGLNHYSAWADALVVHRMEQILLEIDYLRPVPPAPVQPTKAKRKPRPKRTHRAR
jgi:hypothetical protein